VTAAVGVLTVDDQEIFRRLAREVVEATQGFVPLGEASCAGEAEELAARLDPDLVLLDVRMPGKDGFQTARRLSAAHPHATIVLVSSNELEAPAERLAACGAAAFVRKDRLGPARLRQVWVEHGRRPPTAVGERPR
jgi:two-component system, NarL family, invasion response regulator UvrY